MDESLHYTSANHADSLISSINRLRCDRQLCDVILVVEDYRIPVHRLVLSACSPFFQNILETNWDFGVKELALGNVSGEAVQTIIEFCYTSTISVTEESVWTILPVAFTFQLEELVNLCCDFISSFIKNETCLQSHTLAVQCYCSDLKQLCANYIQDNFETIIEEEPYRELSVNILLNHLKLLQEDVLTDDQIVLCLRSWVKHRFNDRKLHSSKFAHYFPHLVKKLKEFLPQELFERPVDDLELADGNPFPSYSPSNLSEVSFPDNPLASSPTPSRRSGSMVSINDISKYPTSSSPFGNASEKTNLADMLTETLSVIICTICGELFDTQDDLQTHQDECDDPVLQRKLIAMIKEGRDYELYPELSDPPDSSKPYICPICGKSFGDKKNLGKHVKIHSRDGYVCSVCNKRYSTKSNLQGHIRVHSSDRPYSCDFCGKAFDSYCVLKVHIRTHTGERPFSCPTCGVSFAKNIHLRRHMQIHTGIKPHVCNVCQKHFSRSDHLKRHKQSIHSGEKPHECHVCRKEFVRKYELNKHLRQHASNGETTEGLAADTNGGASTSFDGQPRVMKLELDDGQLYEDEKPDPNILSALFKDRSMS